MCTDFLVCQLSRLRRKSPSPACTPDAQVSVSRTILQEKQPGLLAERADFRNKAWNTQADLETQKIRK